MLLDKPLDKLKIKLKFCRNEICEIVNITNETLAYEDYLKRVYEHDLVKVIEKDGHKTYVADIGFGDCTYIDVYEYPDFDWRNLPYEQCVKLLEQS